MQRILLLMPFFLIMSMGPAIVRSVEGDAQIYVAISMSLVMLGFLLYMVFGIFRPQKSYYRESLNMAIGGYHRYIIDYNETLHQMALLHAECAKKKPGEAGLVYLNIQMLEFRRNDSAQSGMAYAPQGRLTEAAKTLGLETNAMLVKSEVANAAEERRRNLDPTALKARRAPKAVIKTAKQRLEAIGKAERILANAPKGTML